MRRKVIKIDEDLCNGCGLCVEGCHEGALQLIDGKARVINEVFCDGLGACIGECPAGAIEIEERDAAPYDEGVVMAQLVHKGENTIRAHLLHLKEHKEELYFKQGLDYLKEHNIDIDMTGLQHNGGSNGSTGSTSWASDKTEIGSQLSQWPIQLHLLNPQASYFKNADVVLAADCAAFSFGNFHNKFIKNHSLAIACPKLDTGKEKYIEKLTAMIDISTINTLSVVIMEVPCCGGLLQLAQQAAAKATRKIPIKKIVIGIKGNILKQEWI
ncbi:4Fe-4S ferredoxin [Campylobacterota bacterium]|nr:4Fe-4S ferredoxin [Campylobacterota bacterium]